MRLFGTKKFHREQPEQHRAGLRQIYFQISSPPNSQISTNIKDRSNHAAVTVAIPTVSLQHGDGASSCFTLQPRQVCVQNNEPISNFFSAVTAAIPTALL